MRQLKTKPTGFTLIEMMVALAILAILVTQGLPSLVAYLANSRLKAVATAVQAEALYARSEAIKRNTTVRLAVSGSALTTSTVDTSGTVVELRSQGLPDGGTLDDTSVDFSSGGYPAPLGTEVRFAVATATATCSDTIRCPAVVVEAGGGVRYCGQSSNCP